LQQHKKNGEKVLYITERTIPFIFWQKSLGSSGINLDSSLSLSNEIFMGFNGSQPSCQKGIVLCQGHPFGAVLSVVFNQLWIRAQLHPKTIIYYTANHNHANQLKAIAERIGAQITIKTVSGCNVSSALKKNQTTSLKQNSAPEPKKQTNTHSEIKKTAPEKSVKVSKPKKKLVIDKSKLVGV
jgi:hypothetical protein